MPFPSSPLPKTHTMKALPMGQFMLTFLSRRLYSLGLSDSLFSEKHMPFDTLYLTWDWNFVLITPFSTKAAFIKDDKTSHFFFHYIFCFHVLSFWDLFFFPSLCLLSPSCLQHPAPPVTVLTELQERTLLQSSLWRISYKSL